MSQNLLLIWQISNTIYNGLQGFLKLLACALEIVIVIPAAERAVIHQLKSDMHGYTVIFRQHIPIVLNVLNNTFTLD